MARSTDDAVPQSSPFRDGEVIADKYRVDGVLGAGGMGVVVRATHLDLNQVVAVKLLVRHALDNDEAVARFKREARATARLQSEHITRVTDAGRLETGEPYMAMELLDGSDLSAVIQNDAPLPIHRAVGLIMQACEGIAEAHSQGIIHRDLKPANLFLTERSDGDPLVKVLDFGISKITNAPGHEGFEPSLTATTTVLGSPAYMSPEQLESAKYADERSDIWSLTVILYELLAARPVFEAESFPGLCAMIARDPATPIRKWRPDVPEALDELIARCLDKDPAGRIQTMAELLQELEPYATDDGAGAPQLIGEFRGEQRPSQAPTLPLPVPPQTAESLLEQSSTLATYGVSSRSMERKNRRWAFAAGAFFLIGLVVGVGYWISWTPGSTLSTPPSSVESSELNAAGSGAAGNETTSPSVSVVAAVASSASSEPSAQPATRPPKRRFPTRRPPRSPRRPTPAEEPTKKGPLVDLNERK